MTIVCTFFSSRFYLTGVLVALSYTDEQVVDVLDLSAENLQGAFTVEFNNRWEGFGLDKLDDGFGSDVTLEHHLGVVEFVEQEDGRVARDRVLIQHFDVIAETETNIVNFTGGC